MRVPLKSARAAQDYARTLVQEQGWSAAQAWQAAMSNMRHEYNVAKHRALSYGFTK